MNTSLDSVQKSGISEFAAPDLTVVDEEQLVLVIAETWKQRLLAILSLPLLVGLKEISFLNYDTFEEF